MLHRKRISSNEQSLRNVFLYIQGLCSFRYRIDQNALQAVFFQRLNTSLISLQRSSSFNVAIASTAARACFASWSSSLLCCFQYSSRFFLTSFSTLPFYVRCSPMQSSLWHFVQLLHTSHNFGLSWTCFIIRAIIGSSAISHDHPVKNLRSKRYCV